MAVGTSTEPQMAMETDADSPKGMETDMDLFAEVVEYRLSVKKLRDVLSARLTDENLATILNTIYKTQIFFEMGLMDDKFNNIDSCQRAIRTVSGLADALRNAHSKKSYYSICSMGKCSHISQCMHNLTPYTSGTPSTAARDANDSGLPRKDIEINETAFGLATPCTTTHVYALRP